MLSCARLARLAESATRASSAKRASRFTRYASRGTRFRLYQDDQTRILRVTMHPAMRLRGEPFNNGAECLGELTAGAITSDGVFLEGAAQDILNDGGQIGPNRRQA